MFSTLICGAAVRRRCDGRGEESTQECARSGPRGAFIAFLSATPPPRLRPSPQPWTRYCNQRFTCFGIEEQWIEKRSVFYLHLANNNRRLWYSYRWYQIIHASMEYVVRVWMVLHPPVLTSFMTELFLSLKKNLFTENHFTNAKQKAYFVFKNSENFHKVSWNAILRVTQRQHWIMFL